MTLDSFRDLHRGETIVVCGCGSSLNDLPHPERLLTIGVNDVGRRFEPTYLVVVNPRAQFTSDRFRYVEQSRARYVFTQLDLGLPRGGIVRFRLGQFGGTTFDDPGVLHYTRNSPYVALCLALHLGARRIGLIGVDFTEHHFFGPTGSHPLTQYLAGIDAEYARLARAAARAGVEIVNLSASSRLTAFPKAPVESWLAATEARGPVRSTREREPRVFCVTYQFLSCGDVFTTGLRHAAAELGVAWADAPWDAPDLPARVAAFDPDLLFVVHGRRFAQRWSGEFANVLSAVWLLDEPYEVDDTTTFSGRFHHVFVNDPSTLGRHRNAHYLPVCYDPAVHHPAEGPRPYAVGFVGGANPTRERVLLRVASSGRLSYVAGGPWRSPALQGLSRGRVVPPAETAALYRATRIVVNVFRSVHHFNGLRLPATSMNPRIYEALACGALVVSEPRPEIAQVLPELPLFERDTDLPALVDGFLDDPDRLAATRDACRVRLQAATYADRLRRVIDIALRTGSRTPELQTMTSDAEPAALAATGGRASEIPPGWERCDPVDVREHDGDLVLSAVTPFEAGSERGLVTAAPHGDVELSFEAQVPAGAFFIAKINQTAKHDQLTNSYHVCCDGGAGYLARHFCVFKTFALPPDDWMRLRLVYESGWLRLYEADRLLHQVRDALLPAGYAFVGVKRGRVRLRALQVRPALRAEGVAPLVEHAVVCAPDAGLHPRVSIITTVYDRVECLEHCIRSVRRLEYGDYEHIIVSDAPAADVVARIAALVRSFDDRRLSYLNLARRHNNWGIAPASAGLRHARGEYLCFLSDDNGYTPEHVGTLVGVLDGDPSIGFAYSSCRYAGRLLLRHPEPSPARIDLGQPMFRRSLFTAHLNDDLPFAMMAWDWAMIESFITRGVRWKHVDVPSFIFRLAQYPQLMVPA